MKKTEEVISIDIFFEHNEGETPRHAKARLQQELINRGYRIAGDNVKKIND